MKKYNDLEQDALDFLRENYVAVVATCFEGEPHASAVYYDVDHDFNVYFISKRNTWKAISTILNARMAFVVGTGPEHINVQARGNVEVLRDRARIGAINRMIVRFTTRRIENFPIQVMKNLRDEPNVVFKFTPDELTFMNLNSKKYPKSISAKYHKII